MAIATISVDLADFGLDLDTDTPSVITENFLDLMVTQRERMQEQTIRVEVDGTETDVVLSEGTETPIE